MPLLNYQTKNGHKLLRQQIKGPMDRKPRALTTRTKKVVRTIILSGQKGIYHQVEFRPCLLCLLLPRFLAGYSPQSELTTALQQRGPAGPSLIILSIFFLPSSSVVISCCIAINCVFCLHHIYRRSTVNTRGQK